MATKTSLVVRVKCPYGEKCSDTESGKCQSCRHNELRSYYEPNYQVPYYPDYTPYYPYWDTTTIPYERRYSCLR